MLTIASPLNVAIADIRWEGTDVFVITSPLGVAIISTRQTETCENKAARDCLAAGHRADFPPQGGDRPACAGFVAKRRYICSSQGGRRSARGCFAARRRYSLHKANAHLLVKVSR